MNTFTRLLSTALLSPPFVFLPLLIAEKPDPTHPTRELSPVVEGGKGGIHRRHASSIGFVKGEGEQIEMLRRLLDTPPEKLRLMRETIQRLEKMSPKDREDMRRRLKRFRELPQQRRSEMFRNFHYKQNSLRSYRDSLRSYWDSLPASKREKAQLDFQRLSPHERKAFVDRVLGRSEHPRKPHLPSSGPPPRKVPHGRPPPPPR
ncbi:MAG: hypothetical protein HOH25_03460 [Opitutae bacterium]|nr:hypothetical protein [Opitutae bacterium]